MAQHTFDVTAITLVLADELQRGGVKLDLGRALSMAVVHDWAEASVGDFPYTALKHLEAVCMKKSIEERALEEILSKLPNKEKYLSLWREYSEKRSLEARLVHAADYLSMLVQALKYRERGVRSKELEELWHAVHRDLDIYEKELPPTKALIRELDKRYLSLP